MRFEDAISMAADAGAEVAVTNSRRSSLADLGQLNNPDSNWNLVLHSPLPRGSELRAVGILTASCGKSFKMWDLFRGLGKKETRP